MVMRPERSTGPASKAIAFRQTSWQTRRPGLPSLSSWDKNKGDPGSSDERLANLQFALALLTALQTGHVIDKKPLQVAARRVAADQHPSGAWLIDSGTAVGSPATYGSTLATAMACRVLKASGLDEHKRALESAERGCVARRSTRFLPLQLYFWQQNDPIRQPSLAGTNAWQSLSAPKPRMVAGDPTLTHRRRCLIQRLCCWHWRRKSMRE